ncbi:MAG: 5'-methylthioadenosine/adenosylhomocysteine nucleosidase [Muribaculaceae bacterium]|nr:5'-methylthioadenosine/adenosylhomocysteine nucleosidase [Muribaculaceae bacterium]
MKIGIIVAMGKELALLTPMLGNATTSSYNGFEILSGAIGRHSVAVMKCGIGKVNAAIGTLAMIDTFAPHLIINTGVAGGTGQGAGVLDIVIGNRVAYHDVWCGPGTEWGEAAGCPPYFEADPAVAALPCFDRREIKRGLIASGDIFVSRVEEVERIKALYPDVMAVDMESGAIAQTCHMKGVRFFCFRVISDTPGADDNISQYCNFWTDAPTHTFELLTTIIDQLKD